ncbi:hemolysin family protein [Litorilinea aerophila]|uniref:HlyC/CorC family transporter n=1 Tax=Litorilinea aerophila TaxID=1204385 RepID=A0A540VEQ4_9CHLR|nr:hemolysin family protein [Litorilinea aerophila]MCC9076971.1 hemolysin family protein [Litorilinea aerophila]OUC06659.1 hypothetical protein RY27_19660 [Litorilinea aerophila]GIV76821.1 MAG: hypothetical protein KatS3mg050_1215 [Litorilinea sp.]
MSLFAELLILFLLLAANGFLAMSELAVVSARRARLQQMAEEGHAGARLALELVDAPGRFLSTVQIGITLVGIVAGAFGGVTLSDNLERFLGNVPLLAPYSRPLAVTVVVAGITYLSLVLGELLPKRLALRNAEGIAASVAGIMARLAALAAPLVSLLSVSTDLILKLFGIQPLQEPTISEEEIRLMLEQGAQTGVFEPLEEEIVGQVFRLADRKISALITPRPEIVWIDIHDSPDVIRDKVLSSGRSRFPVADGFLDNVVGIVLAKDLLAQCMSGQPLDIQAVMRPALFVPESMPALNVIERFKETRSKIALVIDEFGGVEGLVTMDDIMEAIVGEIPGPDEIEEVEAVQRDDGSWLIDGLFPLDDFKELLQLPDLPEDVEGHYQTMGGLVMAILGQVPKVGDVVDWQNLRIEVVDMDGRRVDKVLVRPLPPPDSGEQKAAA